MVCKNFVCCFSGEYHKKVICTFDNNNQNCSFNDNMSCVRYEHLGCKLCGNEYVCFKCGKHGFSYDSEKGRFERAFNSDFGVRVSRNGFIDANFYIFQTACRNYEKGYRTSTTVRQLLDKYGKAYPEFTKEYLQNAVEKSIVKYLECENLQFKGRF